MASPFVRRVVYTTGQVAKILGISSFTVNSLVDKGQLRGGRLPGARERRVSHESLIEFLQAHTDLYGAVLKAVQEAPEADD